MRQPCGCCSGTQALTPLTEVNPPGLTSLTYRAGDYSTFFETMLARLSSTYIDVPDPSGSGAVNRVYPLRQLTTRETDDPSIALLNAWAVVADVLTFYQERIANEGYLPTAVERRSMLELARLVGYRLRPGVSASVYLAFTTTSGFDGVIPAGTRAQSVPGTGQTAQFFETSDDLTATYAWNDLGPRLTVPQIITPQAIDTSVPTLGTNADLIDSIYFSGTSTNLKTGDALLIVIGDGENQQTLRTVQAVNPLPNQGYTQVVLQESLPQAGTTATATLSAALGRFVTDAPASFPGSSIASQAAALVQTVLTAGTLQAIQTAIPGVQALQGIAVKREFTRLQAWLGHLLDNLNALPAVLSQFPGVSADAGKKEHAVREEDFVPPTILPSSPLSKLGGILDKLNLPPSLQPADALVLARNVKQTFAPQSDTAPRLLSAFYPTAADLIYGAWRNIETPSAAVQLYALRVRAGLFGRNAPLQIQFQPETSKVSGVFDWPVVEQATTAASTIVHEKPSIVYLDSAYNQILPNSWVVVQTVKTTLTEAQTLFAKAVNPTVLSRGDYGMSGNTTQIGLGDPTDPSQDIEWITTAIGTSFTPNNTPPNDDFQAIRQTTVYAQAEQLDLAEAPLDRDVSGSAIELDGLYDGLEAGRWIIVSGERTDIPNVTGVSSSELAMIAAITQGTGKQSCSTAPPQFIPFAEIFYVAGPNANGDLLVVGQSSENVLALLDSLPVPNAPNQQYCDPIQLSSSFYANAYIPTAAERTGDFSDFANLLVDLQGNPFPNGIIPASRFGSLLAWRIASITSGAETVHTTLTLASPLAYTYDTSDVTIYGNVANATHGQTVGEVLGSGDATQVFQTFQLSQSPLTYLAAATPEGAQSTLTVTVNEIEWDEAANLPALGPNDHGYITQTDNSAVTSVIFGNGVEGTRLPTGSSNIKATYRYGIGSVGNVDANQISQMATQPLGVQGVINPLAATGGADADTIDQARRNIPVAMLALDRLVSVQDYADFARDFAGIAKASAAWLSDGVRQLVHLTIAGVGDVPIATTDDLYKNLVAALEQYGDPLLPFQVCLRAEKLLVISAGVQLLPDYVWESVQPAITSALQNYFAFDQRALGQSAFLSEAISVMQGVTGVSYVNVQVFDSVSSSVSVQTLAGLANTLKLRQVVEAQLARPNLQSGATAADPCQRILPAGVVFLNPDLPETLILTQIAT